MYLAKNIFSLSFILNISIFSSYGLCSNDSTLDDISNCMFSIKYVDNALQTEKTQDLYSRVIDSNKITFYDYEFVSNPKILRQLEYNNKSYELCDYRYVKSLNRPDGASMPEYTATYFRSTGPIKVSEHGFKNNNNTLTEIHYNYETTHTFTFEKTVTREIGTGGEIFGLSAKAGIKSSLSEAGLYGSGASYGIQFVLDSEKLIENKYYTITRYDTAYEFISVIYTASYIKRTLNNKTTYLWTPYISKAFITNSLFVSSFELNLI